MTATGYNVIFAVTFEGEKEFETFKRAVRLAGDLGIDLNEYIKRAVAGFNKRMRDYLSR